MSITIIGGHDSMVRDYKNICKEYKCKAKVFTQPSGGLAKQIGQPDMLILFTNTVSHKMVKTAMAAVNGQCPNIVRCHNSSKVALKEILEKNIQ